MTESQATVLNIKIASRSCRQNILPVGRDPELIGIKRLVLRGSGILMSDHEIAARMTSFHTTDTWNAHLIISRPGPLSCKEEDAIDVLATVEEDEFLIDPGNVRPTYVDVQRMIESGLPTSQGTTLDHHIEVMVVTKVVSSPENAKHEGAKPEKTLVYQTDDKVVRQVVASGAVNEVIHMEANILEESHGFVQHLISSLIKNQSYTVSIFIWWNSMRKLPSPMRPSLDTELWPTSSKMKELLHRHP